MRCQKFDKKMCLAVILCCLLLFIFFSMRTEAEVVKVGEFEASSLSKSERTVVSTKAFSLKAPKAVASPDSCVVHHFTFTDTMWLIPDFFVGNGEQLFAFQDPTAMDCQGTIYPFDVREIWLGPLRFYVPCSFVVQGFVYEADMSSPECPEIGDPISQTIVYEDFVEEPGWYFFYYFFDEPVCVSEPYFSSLLIFSEVCEGISVTADWDGCTPCMNWDLLGGHWYELCDYLPGDLRLWSWGFTADQNSCGECIVRAEDAEGSPGDTDVKMYISLDSDVPVTMLSCVLSEDPDPDNYLRPTNMVPTGRATTVTAISFIPFNNSTELMIGTFAWEPIPAGTGPVMEVSYEIDSQAQLGTYTTLLSDVQVIDVSGQPLGAVVENGEFTVTGPTCPPSGYPGEGTDVFPSTAGIQVSFPGIGGAVVKLEGQTVVKRSEPYMGPGELMTIDTEILSMELAGFDPYLGELVLTLNRQYPSTGQIRQSNSDGESPMESFFDVFVELYTGLGFLHNLAPIRMLATIESIPPRAGVFEYVGEPHLPLYDESGLELGYIVNVKHVTQPPRDRFQSTAIFTEVEIYGVGTETDIVLTGPTEVVRGDWAAGEVTTEMVFMELTSLGSALGPITVREDPSKISTGLVSSLEGEGFPADSWLYVNLVLETEFGTGFACAPVEATINAFPPIGDEYRGPHDVDIVDENGVVIGRIRSGFVHLPEAPLEPPPISTLPSAGWDCFDSEAQITLQIGQDQETVHLTGPTIVTRGNPSDPGDGLLEVQTEIIFMALEGTSFLLGGPITIAECDSPSLGKIKQLKPELGLPAVSDFTVNFDLLTPYGTYWGQQAPVIALIDSIPPENEEYQGPHPVVITDPITGEDIGLIVDFVHIPREPIPCPEEDFPEADDDCMITTAVITLEIGEMLVPNVTVTGTTRVSRGTPYDPDDGRNKIDTEILSMDLSGRSQLGDITVTQSPYRASVGYIKAKQTDRDYPAESFFDIFVEVDIPGTGPVHNEEPIPMRAKIDKIPPTDRIYYPPYSVKIPVYDPTGVLVGYIVHVTHKVDSEIPCPPERCPPCPGGERGDVNADGVINVVDVLTVVLHILGKIPITDPDMFCRADCNCDGIINILDPLGIANVVLEIFPYCGSPTCKAEVTPEVLEFLESLRSYLSDQDYEKFMALIKSDMGVPAKYNLVQNYPNPFNAHTDIKYEIPALGSHLSTHVALKIYNLLGQEVKTLVDEPKESGYHVVSWNGTDKNGQAVVSGIYFYRLQAGSFVSTRRMALIR